MINLPMRVWICRVRQSKIERGKQVSLSPLDDCERRHGKECVYYGFSVPCDAREAVLDWVVSSKTTDDDDARVYPCADCGVSRSAAEGGTVFTVCDECWDKHFGKDKEASHE